jgi:hypothetical protein
VTVCDRSTHCRGRTGIRPPPGPPHSERYVPDYAGISLVVLPDSEGSLAVTVDFNADERKGVTKVHIYTEMRGPMNSQLAAIQAAAKRITV